MGPPPETGLGRWWAKPFFTVNQQLATLYRDAASGECPVIHDPSRQTCAGSRSAAGPTVVEVDSSLRETIHTGGERYDAERLGLLVTCDEIRAERNLEKTASSAETAGGASSCNATARPRGGPVHHGLPKGLPNACWTRKPNSTTAQPQKKCSSLKKKSATFTASGPRKVNLAKMIKHKGERDGQGRPLCQACTEAGAKDPVAMAALLRELIDEETQTTHQTRPRNILIR